MKKIPLFLALAIVLFATGCPKYKPKEVDLNNSNSFTKKLNTYFAAQQQRYINALDSGVQGPERAKAIRNQFIEDVLPYIDETYMDFITDLQAGRDRTNFMADLIELGTSAAVGIVNGERSLKIMGIALTAFRGGRRSADLNFYREQTTPVLIHKMDGNRAEVRATILSREKDDVTSYPIGAAISDIVDYYNAGTLVRAFTELQKDTASQTQQAEKDLRDLKIRTGILLAPTEEEIRISRENSDAVDALVDAYETADDNVSDAETKVANATQAFNNAVQRSAEATQRIADERAKPNPNQTVIIEAEAAKTQAEADKTKAQTDKTQAEGEKTAAETARTTALNNLKGTYQAIDGDPALSPLLDKIVDLPGYSAPFKAKLQASLTRLKENTATVDDYALIMLQVGKVVRLNLSKDPTLNERLQTILKANK